jgi:hypothetical protein
MPSARGFSLEFRLLDKREVMKHLQKDWGRGGTEGKKKGRVCKEEFQMNPI